MSVFFFYFILSLLSYPCLSEIFNGCVFHSMECCLEHINTYALSCLALPCLHVFIMLRAEVLTFCLCWAMNSCILARKPTGPVCRWWSDFFVKLCCAKCLSLSLCLSLCLYVYVCVFINICICVLCIVCVCEYIYIVFIACRNFFSWGGLFSIWFIAP